MRKILKAMQLLKSVWLDESGVGVVEIILILVVLISLVLLFKSQITSLVKTTLTKIKTQAGTV